MTRNALIGLLVALVVIGIPIALVIAGGDDEPAAPVGSPTVTRDGPVPTEDPSGGPQRDAGGKPVKQPGRGAPKDSIVYDGPPAKPRDVEAAMAGVGYPDAVTRAGTSAATIVERRLGRELSRGQPTVIAADCRDGTCSLRIRSEPRGTGRIIDNQAKVLRGLFARREVRTVVLYIHHEIKGRGKNERPAFIKLTCRRARHPRFDWARLTSRQLARRCTTLDQAGGKLRNEVRRGQLTNEQASRGAKARRGPGDGGGQKPRRQTPAERRAQRREMEELRRQREAAQKRDVQSEQEARRGR